MRNLLSALAVLIAVPSVATAADHLDAPSVTVDATTDINDLYAWTSADGTKVNLILTVHPIADGASTYSDAAQYVFHTTSWDAYGGTAGTDVDIICQFDAAQNIECWLGAMDYASGDASTELASTNGMFKVHTGLHDDPFFFNAEDFNATVAAVNAYATQLTFDAAGCPDTTIDGTLASPPLPAGPIHGTLAAILTGASDGASDFFAPFNTLAIVLEVDKAALTGGGDIVSVWGATRQKTN